MLKAKCAAAIVALFWGTASWADIPNDPTLVRPLSVGMRAPEFAARTKDGVERQFHPEAFKKPTVVIFYRGGWCPYCNTQLSDLRLVEPKLRQSGFEVVFLSTDRPAILYSSLKAEKISYTLLSDSRLEAAKAFHAVTIRRRVQKQAVPSIAESNHAPQVLGSESPRLEVKDGVGFTEIGGWGEKGMLRKKLPGRNVWERWNGLPKRSKTIPACDFPKAGF